MTSAVDDLKARTIAMSNALSEQMEATGDDACVDDAQVESLLRQCVAGVADEHVDSEFVFAFAFLAGLVEPREFFEHAYRLIGLFVDDDDDDKDDADGADVADDSLDPDVRAQLVALRDELLQSRLASEVPTVPGLVEFGEMTPAFLDAVKATFARFDLDRDGVLNPAEFCEYHRVVNPDHPTVNAATRDYVANFDCAPNGLTDVGFLQLYFSQAMSDPDEVRKDMRNAGFPLPAAADAAAAASSSATVSASAPAPAPPPK